MLLSYLKFHINHRKVHISLMANKCIINSSLEFNSKDRSVMNKVKVTIKKKCVLAKRIGKIKGSVESWLSQYGRA